MILVRHTTPQGGAGLCYGRTDLPVADSFDNEAQSVLQRMPDVTAIVSSPLRRCAALAQRIGAHKGLTVTYDDAWREIDFGAWEGTPWDAVPRAALDAWAADMQNYRGHGGESVAQLTARVDRARARVPLGAVVVTHAGCIRVALALNGHPDPWSARIDFGSLVEV